MSEENINRFLETTEAFNRRDVERWLQNFHPYALLELQNAALEGEYLGHDGLRRFLADFAESWEMAELHCPDVRDLGDRVLGLGTMRTIGRGAGSSRRVRWRSWRATETGCARTSRTTASGVKRSKPPGCRSRRCQRRTSRWPAAALFHTKRRGPAVPIVLDQRLGTTQDRALDLHPFCLPQSDEIAAERVAALIG